MFRNVVCLLALSCFVAACGRDVVEPPVTTLTPPPALVLHNVTPTTGPFSITESEAVSFALIGLMDPVKEEIITYSRYETLWVLEDEEPVEIEVQKLDDADPSAIDMVFVVDNSGSMDEESDRIGEGILAYAAALTASGWDIRFGAVGQNGSANGGIGLTDVNTFSAYLSRSRGRQRTRGFDGPDAAGMESWAAQNSANGENGVIGILCAEEVFRWRPQAVRVFINFTDEPVQSGYGTQRWETGSYCSAWTPSKGTVHTVWSGGYGLKDVTWGPGTAENPADLSDCTGGSVLEVRPDASDLDLSALPFVIPLQESVVIRFVSRDVGAEHKVEIVVKNGDTADGNLVLENVRYH